MFQSEVHSRLHSFFFVSPGRGYDWIASERRLLTVGLVLKIVLFAGILVGVGLLWADFSLVAFAMLGICITCLIDVCRMTREFRDAEALARQRRFWDVCISCGAKPAAETPGWCERCGFEDSGCGRFHKVKFDLGPVAEDVPCRQFSLAALMAVVTAVCVVSALIRWLGVEGLLISGVAVCLYCTLPNLLGIRNRLRIWTPKLTVVECLVLVAIMWILGSLLLAPTVHGGHYQRRGKTPPAIVPPVTTQPAQPSAVPKPNQE